MSLSDEEFERIKKLWAEAYLKLTEIGQIIGKHARTFEERLGTGGTEITAIIQRKDGSIRRVQEYKFKGEKDKEGKPVMVLKDRKIKDFPKE